MAEPAPTSIAAPSADECIAETKADHDGEEIRALLVRKQNLLLLIGRVDAKVEAAVGVRVAETQSTQLQNGIRIRGTLSFRGKQKAAELFECFSDTDYLSYDGFRGDTCSMRVCGVRDHSQQYKGLDDCFLQQ
jgi:hypothetical protein